MNEISPRRRRSFRNSRPVLQATSVRSTSKKAPTCAIKFVVSVSDTVAEASLKPQATLMIWVFPHVLPLCVRRPPPPRSGAGSDLTWGEGRGSKRAVMRLTGGSDRGRRLRAPRGAHTRPTAAKVREAIFNILGPPPDGSVLDLYAGTGALGLEALSRGASSAVFVERDHAAIVALRRNLR